MLYGANNGMGVKSAILLVILWAFSPAFASQKHTTALTDDDVISMVQHGVPESTILAKIKTSETNLNTSPDAAEILKEAGVSFNIISAMSDAQPMEAKDGPLPTPAPIKPKEEKQLHGEVAAVAQSLSDLARTPEAKSGPNLALASKLYGSSKSGFNPDGGIGPDWEGFSFVGELSTTNFHVSDLVPYPPLLSRALGSGAFPTSLGGPGVS
jgi:hypothetical protein